MATFSGFLTVSLNVIFYVWLRILEYFAPRIPNTGSDEPDIESTPCNPRDTSLMGEAENTPLGEEAQNKHNDIGSSLLPTSLSANYGTIPRSKSMSRTSHGLRPDRDASLLPLLSCPSLVNSPDLLGDSPAIPPSYPTTPNLAMEAHLVNVANSPRFSSYGDSDLESGVKTSKRRNGLIIDSAAYSSLNISIPPVFDSSLATPGSPSSILSRVVSLIQPLSRSPSLGASESTSSLPQYNQDLTDSDPFKHNNSESYYSEETNSCITVIHPGMYDFSVYSNTPTRSSPITIPQHQHQQNLSVSQMSPLDSTFPSIPTSSFLNLPEPTMTPFNTPQKDRTLLSVAPLIQRNPSLNESEITEAFDQAQFSGRPLNTGLRPLLLSRARSECIPEGGPPKALVLPQIVARRNQSTKASKRISAQADAIICKTTPLLSQDDRVGSIKHSNSLPIIIYATDIVPILEAPSIRMERQTKLVKDILELLQSRCSTTSDSSSLPNFDDISFEEGPRSRRIGEILRLLDESVSVGRVTADERKSMKKSIFEFFEDRPSWEEDFIDDYAY
ncbi:hypothetical protein ABKN59_006325 [Abortiporus biennis]